jgi:hypothetical protein
VEIGTRNGHELKRPDWPAPHGRGKDSADTSIHLQGISNLIAAREEQRRQARENGVAFADLRRRFAIWNAVAGATAAAGTKRIRDQGRYRRLSRRGWLQDAGRRAALLETMQNRAGETG